MKLSYLLEHLEYEVCQGSDDIEVTELINDSRKVKEGSVFVCIAGAVTDGHEYIEDVASKGAAAVIVERSVNAPEGMTVIHVDDTRYALALMSAAYFGYPAKKLNVIGITGTKGKTTTTYMVTSSLPMVNERRTPTILSFVIRPDEPLSNGTRSMIGPKSIPVFRWINPDSSSCVYSTFQR